MKHVWSVICKKSVVDGDSNLISLFDCVEQVKVNVLKNKMEEGTKFGVPIEFELTSLWFDETKEKDRNFDVVLEIFDSKNEKIHEFSGKFVLVKNKRRLRSRTKIEGFPITYPGVYILKLKFREAGKKQYEKAAEIPLDVEIREK